MTTYEIGDMFWGKSQSYPWWPCVIMTNTTNEIKRSRKKTGTQYHVQFIGPNYDACWITSNFLIKYNGTENFESYVEQQLRSSMPPQHKHMFEMKMTGQIQAMWIQACQDAEKMQRLSNEERTHHLPKADGSTIIMGKKPKMKKHSSKAFSKMSDSSSVADTVSVDTKCIDIEELISKESLSAEVEEICHNVYMTEEMENRIKNSTEPFDQSELEQMIKEQWSVLDVETKLLYFDGAGVNTSKSRVSGRKIKIPSRLRRTNELETIKKAALRKRASETALEKRRTNSSEISVNIPAVTNEESITATTDSNIPQPSLQLNSIYRETLDSMVLNSLVVQESSLEIVKLVVEKQLPIAGNICHQCLKPFSNIETYKTCKGDCRATFHFVCAMNQKLFRLDDTNKCVNCLPRESMCCICKNSKYMKKQFLAKCTKLNCHFYFHSTCLKYLNFTETLPDDKEPVLCPNHSCLTCCREDGRHPCNSLGTLVSCTKCPISYHSNMICIPAGCRITSEKTIICHKHFEKTITTPNILTRCFVCFADSATLRCCRCRSVFHPKCMNMPTYTDLLKDYICPTCKLEQPLFYGQIAWTEISENVWSPVEIIFPSHVPAKVAANQSHKTLIVRVIETGEYRYADPCELITFAIGESVLKGLMIDNEEVLNNARSMHIVYLNWRKLLRPYMSEKFPIIGQSELLRLSMMSVNQPRPAAQYKFISKNQLGENVQNMIPKLPAIVCSCEDASYPCAGDYCHNYINKIECRDAICHNSACTNRRFATGFPTKSVVVTSVGVISGSGVKAVDNFNKGAIIGEITGRIITLSAAVDLVHSEHANIQSLYYTFQMTADLFLDCRELGNDWRHLNHSCNPNAEVVCWYVAGEPRLGISVLQTVSANEEITVDYRRGGALVLKYDLQCSCRSPNCAVTIGPTSIFANQTNLVVPRCCIDNRIIDESAINHRLRSVSRSPLPSKVATVATISPSEQLLPITYDVVKDNQPKSQVVPIDNSTVCHRCNGRGELICCNKAHCHKRYHLQCVELVVAPWGLWLCPKHYCMVCGQAASAFCHHCSTSHCKTHSKLQKRHSCRGPVTPVSKKQLIYKPEKVDNSNDSVVSVATFFKEENDENDKPDQHMTIGQQLGTVLALSESVDNVRPKEESGDGGGILERVGAAFMNKKDLYSACDLEPIIGAANSNSCLHNSESDLSTNDSNSNSPSQVNLTIKRPSDMTNGASNETVKKPRLARNVVCNISNYLSTDEDAEPVPEPFGVDYLDTRCQVVPMAIEDMENLIVSPMVLDD